MAKGAKALFSYLLELFFASLIHRRWDLLETTCRGWVRWLQEELPEDERCWQKSGENTFLMLLLPP